MKRPQTRLDHERRIEEAVAFLIDNLDDPVELTELADQVCMSRFHFHRVFQALLGETVGEMVRRLRMERAAHFLRMSDRPITEIAFLSGYATLEAFIRAFRAAFGYTPSAFRKRLTYDGHLPTPNGQHFDDPRGERLRFVAPPGGMNMKVEIREIPTRRAVCVVHKGPYYMIGGAFDRIDKWVKAHGVAAQEGIGIYYDDPSAVPPDQLRSHAGQFVADDFTAEDPEVEIVDVQGGLYAVATHLGPYDGLIQTWTALYAWIPTSGYELGPHPAFELYVNRCDEVPANEVRTDIHLSLKKPRA
ncbi:MAG: AraC family transcriptional regulator [Fimbriimonas sp.]